MDEPHHHRNNGFGHFASARAARAKLAALDLEAIRFQALPDLLAQRDHVVAAKKLIAERIAAYGPESHREQDPGRLELVDELRDLSIGLNSLNAQIAALGDRHGPDEASSHLGDLQRRVATGR